MIKEDKVPPPGSYTAIMKGCLCPILTNNFGEGYFVDEQSEFTMYHIDSDCPLHGDKDEHRT